MKKFLLLLFIGTILSCSEKKGSEDSKADERNSEENVTENSGEHISPQLEYDSANRTDVDSVSTVSGEKKQIE